MRTSFGTIVRKLKSKISKKIQIEAARIVTGSTKLVSVEKLYDEAGWERLKDRRGKHKLTLFYKMSTGLTPEYLSNLVPENIGNLVDYNLRNANNTRTLNSNTQLYANSFLPSTVQDWNNLPHAIKNAPSLHSFKSKLNSNVVKVPKYFYYFTDRRSHMMHTRLITHCSALNEHLHSKHIIDSPHCLCGQIEDTNHFILECHNYANQRNTMNNELIEFGHLSLNILLFGDQNLSFDQNVKIFAAVQRFISNTRRF